MKRTPLRRKTPLRARPEHETPAQRSLRAAVQERAEGRCEIGLDGCLGLGSHLHHRRTDDRHEPITRKLSPSVMARFLWLCAHCHHEVHANPARAYEHGWLVHSWDDPWHVPVVGP